jgi:nitronate monooxygenase
MRDLGLPPPELPVLGGGSFDLQLEAALEGGASVFSFTFGTLPVAAVEAIKSRGMFLIGTATTVDEAVVLEKAGVDAVVAQGSEAGAHRGTFAADFEAAMVGTMALVPQVADAVSVPAIASGGIMDGRGLLAGLALGASAAQIGTAFLTCHEAGIPEAYKDAILSANAHQTRMTRAFSGRGRGRQAGPDRVPVTLDGPRRPNGKAPIRGSPRHAPGGGGRHSRPPARGVALNAAHADQSPWRSFFLAQPLFR